jgi:4-amino-4-deoxychorismate lyase
MSQLFESIRIAEGRFENLVYHEQRMRRSLRELFGLDEQLDIEQYLNNIPIPTDAIYKCKLIYDDKARSVELSEYRAKVLTSLKVVEHDRISYELKYADRKLLTHLFNLRGDCDDILIVKKGYVTDSSYGNVAFRKGKEWFTPWQPLLKGTMRQQLLEYNKMREEEIKLQEIKNFEAVKIVNAMLRFDANEIDTKNIVF